MWDAIKITWAVYCAVRKFLKELKQHETEALSDENALKWRTKIEALAVRMQEGQDKSFRKYLQVDNPGRLIRFVRIVMKSQKLADIECGTVVQVEIAKQSLLKA